MNRIQLAVYYANGKYISVNTRTQAWGTHALEFISDQLRRELPGLCGFPETQMKDMRRFYEAWQMLDSNSAVATAILQNVENVEVDNSSVVTDELQLPIEGTEEIVFIFTFVSNQQLLKMYDVEQFPDLLFFNRELNALVVVELKMGKFKTSYLGQLFGYLQILDDKMRKPHENPAIGIVLCQEADHAYAEYAVKDYTKPMGVATYKTLDDVPDEQIRKALPDMKKMLEFINEKKSK